MFGKVSMEAYRELLKEYERAVKKLSSAETKLRFAEIRIEQLDKANVKLMDENASLKKERRQPELTTDFLNIRLQCVGKCASKARRKTRLGEVTGE